MAHVLYDAIININLHRFDWVGLGWVLESIQSMKEMDGDMAMLPTCWLLLRFVVRERDLYFRLVPMAGWQGTRARPAALIPTPSKSSIVHVVAG